MMPAKTSRRINVSRLIIADPSAPRGQTTFGDWTGSTTPAWSVAVVPTADQIVVFANRDRAGLGRMVASWQVAKRSSLSPAGAAEGTGRPHLAMPLVL
jgi:hypothetical protein